MDTTHIYSRELPAWPVVPRRRSRRFWSRLLLFAASVMLVNGMIGERGLIATMRARRALTAAADDLARLRQENQALRERARQLRHDPRTIEAVARRELGLARAQEMTPGLPDELIVTVVSGKRVFIASSPVKAAVATIPACDEVWQGYKQKMDEALAAYNKTDPKDESLFEAYTRLEEKADRDYRGCYAEEALKAPFYKDLMKQAQALAGAMPR